eukprot:scaffold229424_cov24-Attheya_sp.AAC.1
MTQTSSSERVASRPYSAIKFGKRSHVEMAIFLPDGTGLVTGSSDGFVEIWDPANRYSTLRQDLKYQTDDEGVLLHETAVLALAVTADGT